MSNIAEHRHNNQVIAAALAELADMIIRYIDVFPESDHVIADGYTIKEVAHILDWRTNFVAMDLITKTAMADFITSACSKLIDLGVDVNEDDLLALCDVCEPARKLVYDHLCKNPPPPVD